MDAVKFAAFWDLFRRRAGDLALAASADDPVYDALLAQLQQVHPGLLLEFSAEGDGGELIVTADGDPSLFSLARAIVAAASPVPKWSIRALKPQLGFPRTTRWNDCVIRIDEIVFDPLDLAGTSDLGIRVFVPGITASDVDAARAAVIRALHHGLGEQRYAESIAFLEVRPTSECDHVADLIPLVQLDSFIKWRATRHGPRDAG
jgi:hypothetical protein